MHNHTTAIRECIRRQVGADSGLALEALTEVQALEALIPSRNRQERIEAFQAMIKRLERELDDTIDGKGGGA